MNKGWLPLAHARMEHDDLWQDDFLVLEKVIIESVEAVMINLYVTQEVNTLAQPRVITWEDMKKAAGEVSAGVYILPEHLILFPPAPFEL